MTRELGDRDVHPEADPEIRDRALAGDAAGEDLPLPPARAEAAGDEDAVDLLELARRLLVGHVLGVHPADAHAATVVDARVLQRLVHGEVRVVELHVLADERDLDLALELSRPLDQLAPLAEIGRPRIEPELLADELVEPLGLEHLGDEVDVTDVGRRDHGARIDVGEERDLLADVVRERLGRPADDDVGVDTDAAELVHRVLRRLRLQLAGRGNERDERDVQVDHVLGPDLAAELANRLEERQRLDVADRAADLGDDDVGGRHLLRPPDPRLDLVRDVRDHLHGRAQELALALAAENGVPDGARGVARVPREVLVDEPLVVADVEVGLGAVLGDEHLAVLERAHRARIDVQVRVELLRLDCESACLEETAERRGDDPLPERRDDAPRDEHVLGHGTTPYQAAPPERLGPPYDSFSEAMNSAPPAIRSSSSRRRASSSSSMRVCVGSPATFSTRKWRSATLAI